MGELEAEGAFAAAQVALTRMLDDLRALAGRYDPDAPDRDLVSSLRAAMAEAIEGVEILSNAVPIEEIRYHPDPEIEARTVHLVPRRRPSA